MLVGRNRYRILNTETLENKNGRGLTKTTATLGVLALASVALGGARYAFPNSENILTESGIHAAGGLVFGTILGLAKSRSGDKKPSLKKAIGCFAAAGLGGLAMNVCFEYIGHPIEELFNSFYAKGRELFTAYGDWKEDNIAATLGSVVSYLLVGASVKPGSGRKKLKRLTDPEQPQR